MENIENLIDKIITTSKFDDRVALYVKEFFLYNFKHFGWDEKNILQRAELLRKRINKFEFVDLLNSSAMIDYENKNALLNSLIKNVQYDRNSATALISTIFEKLDILSSKNINIQDKRQNYLKTKIKLKYSVNQKENERLTYIVNIIDNLNQSNKVELQNFFSYSAEEILNSENKEDNFYKYIKIIESLMIELDKKKDLKSADLVQLSRDMQIINNIILELRHENTDIEITHDKLKKYEINIFKCIEKYERIQQFLKEKDIPQSDTSKANINNFKNEIDEKFIEKVRPEFEHTKLSDEYIKKSINMLDYNYEAKFIPIINEYFIRSARVYNWSKEEFDKKLHNFLNNVDKIEVTERKDRSNSTFRVLFSKT